MHTLTVFPFDSQDALAWMLKENGVRFEHVRYIGVKQGKLIERTCNVQSWANIEMPLQLVQIYLSPHKLFIHMNYEANCDKIWRHWITQSMHSSWIIAKKIYKFTSFNTYVYIYIYNSTHLTPAWWTTSLQVMFEALYGVKVKTKVKIIVHLWLQPCNNSGWGSVDSEEPVWSWRFEQYTLLMTSILFDRSRPNPTGS